MVRNCKTDEEVHDKLDGIMTQVSARVFNEAKPLILGNIELNR